MVGHAFDALETDVRAIQREHGATITFCPTANGAYFLLSGHRGRGLVLLDRRGMLQHAVDKAIGEGFLGGHVVIAVLVLLHGAWSWASLSCR